MISLAYIILAFIGLGVLVFIHELGHYFMARRVGMKVEAFSIGFGKPIRTWNRKGVKWQLCILPFGGYVKIAGMEKKGNLEPHQISDGFFGKKPIDRIKVAVMGPLVNIVFAFFMFALIWVCGGRLKPFSDYTKIVGWVEPQSKFSEDGIKPGDQFLCVDETPVQNMNDLVYALIFHGNQAAITADHVDYWTGQKSPFSFSMLKNPGNNIEQLKTDIRALQPASFLYYDKQAPIIEGAPMENSGIRFGDRIIWADGEIIFSVKQLSSLINQPRILLTVQRDKETFLARVPRLLIGDIKLSDEQKAEIDDWRNEARLEPRLGQLFFIPYSLTNDAVIEESLTYVDERSEHCSSFDPLKQGSCSILEKPLMSGDKIIAVDGQPVQNSFEFLASLQERKILIAVADGIEQKAISWKEGDISFIREVNWNGLKKMVDTIGTPQWISSNGNLRFLNPVVPKTREAFPQSKDKSKWMQYQIADKERIEKIEDLHERESARKEYEAQMKQLVLGIPLQDMQVRYNPSPFIMLGEVVGQTGQTLKALFSGNLTPKAMQGPVGIVQVIHYGWMVGVKEALFWMGVISLNLGIFNLLPIPVLDGGHIGFSLWEMVTKKRIKAKTMERLVIPFVILLVAALIFTTYQDLLRLFKNFF